MLNSSLALYVYAKGHWEKVLTFSYNASEYTKKCSEKVGVPSQNMTRYEMRPWSLQEQKVVFSFPDSESFMKIYHVKILTFEKLILT